MKTTALEIACMIKRTPVEDRGILFHDIAWELRIMDQFFTAKLLEEAGHKYNNSYNA